MGVRMACASVSSCLGFAYAYSVEICETIYTPKTGCITGSRRTTAASACTWCIDYTEEMPLKNADRTFHLTEKHRRFGAGFVLWWIFLSIGIFFSGLSVEADPHQWPRSTRRIFGRSQRSLRQERSMYSYSILMFESFIQYSVIRHSILKPPNVTLNLIR